MFLRCTEVRRVGPNYLSIKISVNVEASGVLIPKGHETFMHLEVFFKNLIDNKWYCFNMVNNTWIYHYPLTLIIRKNISDFITTDNKLTIRFYTSLEALPVEKKFKNIVLDADTV